MSLIPANFPRRTVLSSLSGAAPKLAVRRTADGMYTNEAPEDEYLEAYNIAEDLAQQMKEYICRKEKEDPSRTREALLQRLREAMGSKCRSGEWEIALAEQDWVMQRVTELLE